MTYREPDHETVIAQKLRAMEDLLKSFMSRLKEPLQEKSILATVEAPVSGTVIEWKQTSGWVGWDTPLCDIRATELYGGGVVTVYYRYGEEGYLHIEVREGYEVIAGETLATIEDTVWA